MVVLSAAVLTKAGKVLLARQFVEMSRVRIEGLLSAFPKLMSSDKQHTFVETENVRYVYQPIEALYLVLITNKSSNIVEDLDTLRMLARLMPDICSNLSEEEVSAKAFDLIFAFDEVISLGYKENLTIDQVKKFLEMDSHEEKLAIMIRNNKMKDAKEEMKRQAKMIQKEKASNPRGYHPRGGISSDDYRPGSYSFDQQQQQGQDSEQRHMSSSNNYIGRSSISSSSPRPTTPSSTSSSGEQEKKVPAGMDLKQALGKKQKVGLLQKIVDEESGTKSQTQQQQQQQDQQQQQQQQSAVQQSSSDSSSSMEAVHTKIGEKISAVISRDGAIKGLELKGFLYLTLGEADNAFTRVQIRKSSNPAFKFTTNPKVDKQLFADSNILALKDTSKGFPTGKALEILRWNYQSAENVLPLTFNIWPSDDAISIEYNLESSGVELSNVYIFVPTPPGAEVDIDRAENGRHAS